MPLRSQFPIICHFGTSALELLGRGMFGRLGDQESHSNNSHMLRTSLEFPSTQIREGEEEEAVR